MEKLAGKLASYVIIGAIVYIISDNIMKKGYSAKADFLKMNFALFKNTDDLS